jgi:hypothetical protein
VEGVLKIIDFGLAKKLSKRRNYLGKFGNRFSGKRSVR